MDLFGPGIFQALFLIDFVGGGAIPPVGFITRLASQLSTHLPYLIHSAHLAHTPFLVRPIVSLLTPLINPEARDKLDVKGVVPPHKVDRSMLVKEWGGRNEPRWEDGYWDAMCDEARQKRESSFERWKALGGKVGTSEWDFRSWDDWKE